MEQELVPKKTRSNSEIRNAIVRHGLGRLSLREAWCGYTVTRAQITTAYSFVSSAHISTELSPLSLSLTLTLRHTRTHTLHGLPFNVCIIIKYASKCMSIFYLFDIAYKAGP